uniref:Uncharacterized protein n=1 Tax=Ascaris lumbricoides TaxID=6252 RepID=A0A0M3I903_ASCLU
MSIARATSSSRDESFLQSMKPALASRESQSESVMPKSISSESIRGGVWSFLHRLMRGTASATCAGHKDINADDTYMELFGSLNLP